MNTVEVENRSLGPPARAGRHVVVRMTSHVSVGRPGFDPKFQQHLRSVSSSHSRASLAMVLALGKPAQHERLAVLGPLPANRRKPAVPSTPMIRHAPTAQARPTCDFGQHCYPALPTRRQLMTDRALRQERHRSTH